MTAVFLSIVTEVARALFYGLLGAFLLTVVFSYVVDKLEKAASRILVEYLEKKKKVIESLEKELANDGSSSGFGSH